MSAPRVIVSAGLVIAAVLGSGWYASRAFPILSAATSPGTGISTAQRPRTADVVQPPTTVAVPVTAQGARSGGAPRPGPAAVAAPRTVTKAITPENPIPRRLSSVPAQYPAQLRGSGYRGRVTLQVTLEASGSIGEVLRNGSEVGGGDSSDADAARRATDAFYQAATDAVRQWRYQPPADPPIAFFVTVRFDDERDATGVQSDSPTGVAGARTFAPVGTAAFAINRDSLLQLEARMLALRAERDRRAAQFGGQDPQMLELSKQLSNMERELERARELQKRADAAPNTVEVGSPSNRFVTGPGQASGVPVRIGGNIRPPAKTRMVNPEYPAIAQSARVQGVVIVEVVIDEHGRVAEARILRSIPLLDQAALDAVRQWEYAPTLLNGSAVPVVMTVTVQFTLPEQAF